MLKKSSLMLNAVSSKYMDDKIMEAHKDIKYLFVLSSRGCITYHLLSLITYRESTADKRS